jgi:hypothetical protein
VGTLTVRAFSQLMEEWEYYNSGNAMQSVKYVMAKTSPCVYPNTVPIEGMADLTRPSIYKFNNGVVYEYLQIFQIAFDLDYLEVVISLCDVFYKLYERLFHQESFRFVVIINDFFPFLNRFSFFLFVFVFSNHVVYDTIIRLDTRVKHHFINLIAKEFTECSIKRMKENTLELRKLSGAKSLES